MAVIIPTIRSEMGRADSKATIANSVLIIIDAQNAYVKGVLRCQNVETTRVVIKDLLERYRAASAPVIHIFHKAPEGAPIFTPGTDSEQVFPELKPVEGEQVVWKPAPGSFTGTELEKLIRETGKEQVVVTGYQAHGCVGMTAKQSAELGFDTVCVRDAIGGRDIPGATWQQSLAAAMAGFQDLWGTVVESKQIE